MFLTLLQTLFQTLFMTWHGGFQGKPLSEAERQRQIDEVTARIKRGETQEAKEQAVLDASIALLRKQADDKVLADQAKALAEQDARDRARLEDQRRRGADALEAFKRQALEAWTQGGGTPASFAEKWPAMEAELLAKQTVAAIEAGQQRARAAAHSAF